MRFLMSVLDVTNFLRTRSKRLKLFACDRLACTETPWDVAHPTDHFSGHYRRHGLNVQAMFDSYLRFTYFCIAAPMTSRTYVKSFLETQKKRVHCTMCRDDDNMSGPAQNEACNHILHKPSSPLYCFLSNRHYSRSPLIVICSGSESDGIL